MQEMIRQALVEAVGDSMSPGAVAYVGNLEQTFFFEAVGNAQIEPVRAPAQTTTIYDLASLTKVVATTTALLMLREQGLLELDKSVADYLPIPAFRGITVRHFVESTGGLVPGALLSPIPPWIPVGDARQPVIEPKTARAHPAILRLGVQ